MNKRMLLLAVPLLLLAAVVAIPWNVMQVHAATGLVCLNDPSSVPNPAVNPCPASPPAFDGPLTTATGPATQLRVGVYIQGSDAMNGFGVTLLSDHTILTPADADLTGTVLLTATPPGTPSVIVKCIGGILKAGSTCDSTTDSVDTIHFAAVAALGSITPSGVTGLLFTAVYNITGTAPAGGITIDYQTGCVNTSVSGFCVTITNGTQVPNTETTNNGTFDNSAFATSISWITIAVSPATIGPVTPVASQTFTVTASAQNGWPTGQTDLVSFSFQSTQGLSASFSPTSCATGGTSCSVSLTVAANNAPGNYTITAFGNFKAVDSVTTLTSTLASPRTVSIRIWDFGVAVNPSLLVVAPGGTATAVLNVTSLNRFPGTSAAVAISETSSPTGLLFTSTAAPNLTPNGFVLSTLTFKQPGAAPFPFASYSATVSVVVSGTTHTVVVPVKFGNFTISASPSPVSFAPGSTGSSTLRVQSNPAGDFLIAARPTNVAFLTTGSATSTVTVTALNFSAPVALTVSASDPSVTATLSATSFATGAGSTTLTLRGTTAGSFSATVTATSGATSHSAVVTLTVTNPDFTITAPSTVVSVPVGTAGTLVLTIAAGNGFTGTVTLTNPPASTPAGLTCSLSVTSITLGTSGTSTLSCTATVAHVYTVTVTAASGAITHTFIVNYIVPAIVAANNSLGFSGVVKLSNSTSPAGLTVTCATRAVTIGSGGSALDNCTFSSSTPNTYLVTFTGTNNTRGGAVTTTFVLTVTVQPTGGFTLAASPTSVTVNANAAGTSTITATGTGSFTGTITLTPTVSPSTGLTCLAMSSINIASPGGSGTSTLSCSGVVGTYTVTVTGTASGAPTQTAPVAYTVRDFSIAASAVSPAQILAGSSGTSTITVTAGATGYSGTVNLSVSASTPAGLTCTLPPSVTFGTSPQTATLSCSATVAGDYTVTVTGINAALSHTTAAILFHVVDFSIAAGAVSPTQIFAGSSGTSTITVTALNGLTGTVNLAVSVSTPAGLTCTLPASVTFGTSPQTATLSCSATVAGDYTVTVTGTDATLSHTTATILFHVVDFSISAGAVSPTQILAGSSGTSTITVTALNGLTGTVNLAVSVSTPAGLTCTLPASVTFGTSPQTATLSCSAAAAADYTVTVTGTDGTLSHTTASILFHVVDFNIAAGAVSPAQILAGASGTSTITVTAVNGLTGTVNLAASASTPAGLTCTVPNVTFGTSPQTATLSCSATTAGDYTVTVTGTDGARTKTTAAILFHVVDFSIVAGAVSPAQIFAGSSGTSTITVTALNGLTGTVNLAVSASTPAGLSCTLTPTSVTFGTSPQTATLSCSATAAGDYTVTVTGTDSTLSHATAAILFHVVDFSIAAAAVSPTQIFAGSSGTSTITVTALNGLTGTVNLAVSASTPAGLTCTLPASVTFGTSPQTATLSCSATTAGQYTVTVTGTDGTLSHTTAAILFHVVDFTIAAGAVTPAQILAGASGTSTITVTAVNGLTGTVTLTVSASTPAGLTCTLPASVTFGTSPQTATLSCSATTAGDRTVTVTGTDGTLTHTTATILFHVVDFTIAAGAVSPTVILAGSSGTSTITVTAVNGLTGTVNLAVSASTPAGLTCTLPASVIFGTSPQTATLSCSATAAADYTVTVTGTDGTLSHSTATILFHVVDFSISAAAVSPAQIFAGSSGTSTITVTALNGLTGTVNLAVSASTPAGLSCTLAPTSVTFGTSPQTATLSCSATTAGDYTVTVTGTDGTLSHTTAAILFHVVDFTIAAGAVSPAQILATSSGTSTVTVTAVNGLTGTVNLAVSASTPAGLTCTLPASVTFGTSPQTATLSCSATAAGDYTVTVTGTDGTLTHTTGTILFHVVDFTIAAGAVSPAQILAGSSGTSTITVTAVNGLTGTVTLSVSASTPAGLTCTLPASVTFGTSPQTATLSCSATTAADYTVTVTGTDGARTRTTAAILFHVVDFTIAAGAVSPTQILAGGSGTSTVTITAVNGLTGTVTLTVSASTPAGLTCTLPASVTFGTSPQTATLSCTAATAADYTVTVTGTDGTLTHTTATILFHVVDFTIAAGAVLPAQIFAGASGTSTITVTAVNGLTGTVNLAVSASTPAGLTCTLPASVTFGTSPQTATLSCTAASAGDYTVTVTGTDGTLTHTTGTILFHVVDFTIAAGAVSPTQILVGSSGTSTVTVTAVNGLTGTVNLAVSASTPAGLTCTLPASVTFGTSPQTATLSCSATAAGDYTVTVTGTAGTLSHTTAAILFHVVDFTIAAGAVSPAQILAGSSGTSTITVTALNGLTGTVSLSVSVSTPAGLTCTLPASVTFGTSPQTATLSCSATAAGDYTVTVTGTDGARTRTTAAILFHVVDFTIAAGAVSPTQILAGSSGTSTITVTAVNGLTGTVNLAVSASTPAGLTCTLPASVTFGTSPQTATLSCSAATAGDYTVTVTGTDGTLTHTTAAILFHVVDFAIAAGAVSPTQILAGASGTSTITVTALNGLTGTVNLAVSASTPAGLTCTIPASVTFGTSPQTATLSCSATTAGDRTVTVTGTDGTLTHTTATILFHVVDFSLTASPSTVSFSPPGTSTSTITVNALNGFTGSIALTITSTPPAGCTNTISPATVTLPTPNTATLTAGGSCTVTFIVTVSGTSGTLTRTVPVTFTPQADFSISAGAVTPTQILAGASGTSTITLTALNGFTGTVNLSVSASTPAGLTCSLTPTSVTFGTSPQTSTLSCSAATAGDYTVTVTGTSGALTHPTTGILFHVVDYTISAGAVAPTQILAGSSGTSTITVTAVNGFTGTVNLAVSASTPAGLTCTLPASVTFGTSPQTATLSCSATTAGDRTVTVTGTSGTLTHTTATILFHVVDFTIAAGAASPAQILAGASGTSTITVTAVNGLTGTVNLAVSASTPAGLTCTIPASVTFGSSPQTATLSCSAATAADYTVTVTGTDGTLTHTTGTILFHVVDFTIAAGAVSPAQILAGSSGTSTITVSAVNGLTGTVNLAVSASTPAGLTCTLPASVTFGTSPQTATLSCGATTAGDYTVTVTGTDGTLTHTTATILFHVVDFTIAAGAVSPAQILAGASGTSTITVTAVNGLTGTVSLAVSASTPAGLTCTLPASVTFGTSPQTATLSCSAANAADYTVTVTGTDGTLSHTTASILFHVTAFTLTASPTTITYTPPNTGTSTITANAQNGFTGSISLAVTSVVPAGCTATISPASVTLPTPNTATLTAGCTSAISFSVTITGTSGTLTRTVTVPVSPGADFTIAASAVTPTQILAGSSGTSTITLTALNGFTGTVNLAVSASTPAGLTCTLAPTSVTFGTSPQTATLSCSATAGDYTVTVTGTSGALSHTTSAILFHVVDFTIAAGAVLPAQIFAGASGTSTITVTALNGLTGTVNLAVSASTPAGLTCTLPASVTFGTSPQTATLSCSAASAGDYTVTVTGTDGTLSHTTGTILFHVVDFTIAAGAVSPTQILAGGSGASTITVTAVNGLTGTVNLAVSASTPAGLTCTLPASVTFGTSPQTATLSCTAASAGDYTVTVTGTDGTLTHTTGTILFHVVDFTIAAGAVSPTQILVGSSGTSTVTVTAVNGLTGTVNLAVSASTPAGLTCTLPASVTFGTSPQTATLSCTASAAGDYTVTVTGTDGTLSHTTATILFHVVDFTLSASPTTITYIAPNTSTSTITANALNGFTGSISLAVTSVVPAGCTATISPASVTLPTPNTATLTAGCTSAISFSVTITGTSGTLTRTVTISVSPGGQTFTIAASAVTPSQILAGASGTSTITLTAQGGFTGTVNLSVSASTPAGLLCGLTPTSVTFGTSPQTSTLSCSAATAGDYTVTVTGTSGSITQTTFAILFHVVDFAIAAGAVSPTQILAGGSGASTITVTAVNGLTGTVNLAVSASTPAGLTCTLPASVTFGTSPQTATLSCSATTAGQYTVTVTGTDGTLSHTTATILFHVVDFTIAAGAVSPTQILAGGSGISTITVTAVNGLTGTVNLAVSASTPAGLTCTLPASVTFGSSPQTATLSCSATTAGQYTVTVTGTDGTLSHTTASILFHVVDFTIAAGAVSPTQILVGASGTSTITVTAINGLTGTVNLAVSASTPAGLTCTLPASVTFGTSPQTATLSCSAATAGDYTVIVTGTDGTLSHMTATILFHVTDFTLTSSPSSISYTAPNTGTSTISANALNGFTGSISLAVTSVVPAGCTATISPASVTLPTPNAATLTAGCTGAISFSVTITGTSGTLTRTVIVAVSPGGQDFSISASAVTPSQILAGASGTSTITVTSIGSFTGTVNLSVSASTPAGLLCGLTPTSVTFGTSPQTSTLSCSAATAGDYTVTVTGTSGGLTHTTSAILFHVVDFTISASAPAAAPADGTTTASSTVTVTGLNGFAGAVTLSATAPAPLVCSVTPSSVTLPPSPQTSTVSCKSTSAGTFSVAITATSGSLSHSATATFNFNDFTISPSAAVTVNCTPGVTCTTPISASSVNGFAGSVSLTTSPSAGLTATLGKSVLVLSSGFDSTTLSLSAAANGDYTVTVTGTSGLLSHTTAVITLHVTTPDFTITASPASFTISVGGTGTSTITITPINGFSGTVSLTATVNPSTGLTASLSPTSIMMSGSSTLTVMGSLNGTYIVTVTGTSGTITHSTNVNVTVSGAQVSAPAFGQSNWKQRLQLSKNNFQQQWRFGLQNTDPSTTVYAQVQINVVDGAGFVPFTLTSSVITLAPNQLLTNLILTKTFTNADIGRSFSFQMVILWGTSPTSLTQQSTAAIGFVRTSGSFTILA